MTEGHKPEYPEVVAADDPQRCRQIRGCYGRAGHREFCPVPPGEHLGTWAFALDDGTHSPDAHVMRAVGDQLNRYDITPLISDVIMALNDALPAGYRLDDRWHDLYGPYGLRNDSTNTQFTTARAAAFQALKEAVKALNWPELLAGRDLRPSRPTAPYGAPVLPVGAPTPDAPTVPPQATGAAPCYRHAWCGRPRMHAGPHSVNPLPTDSPVSAPPHPETICTCGGGAPRNDRRRTHDPRTCLHWCATSPTATANAPYPYPTPDTAKPEDTDGR